MSHFQTAGELFHAEAQAEREIADHFADPDSRWYVRETTQALADQIAICTLMAWPPGESMDRRTVQIISDNALFSAQTIKLRETASRY